MDANLYELIRGRRHYLNAQLIRSYMYQLLRVSALLLCESVAASSRRHAHQQRSVHAR